MTDTGRFEIERRMDLAREIASMKAVLEQNTKHIDTLIDKINTVAQIQVRHDALYNTVKEMRVDIASLKEQNAQQKAYLDRIESLSNDMTHVKSELQTWKTARVIFGWILSIITLIAGAAALKYFKL